MNIISENRMRVFSMILMGLVLGSQLLLAQSSPDDKVLLIGKLVECDSVTSVPFAFVANSQTGYGKETDEKGIFKLNTAVNDTLFFRSLGYQDSALVVTEQMLSDTLLWVVTKRNYEIDEVKVLMFRSYASFRHMVANMEDMAEPSSEPFKIDVRAALAEKKAESGVFGASIRLAGKHIPKEEREYNALLAHEKLFERYNKLTSHENLKSFTNLEGAKLDSFIVFLRSKHNIDPKLNDYDLMAAISDIYKDFLALQSDTIRISRQ